MPLGPRWENKFIPPAPPISADHTEIVRYVQQLHDQLSVTFEDAQRILNQNIIIGDGDGGPGPGAIDPDILITLGIPQGNSYQMVPQRLGDIAPTNLPAPTAVPPTAYQVTVVNPAAGDVNRRYDVIAERSWDRADMLWIDGGGAGNGAGCNIRVDYTALTTNLQNADVSYTVGTVINQTPTGTFQLRITGPFTIAATAGDLLALQIKFVGQAVPQNTAYRVWGLRLYVA